MGSEMCIRDRAYLMLTLPSQLVTSSMTGLVTGDASTVVPLSKGIVRRLIGHCSPLGFELHEFIGHKFVTVPFSKFIYRE